MMEKNFGSPSGTRMCSKICIESEVLQRHAIEVSALW